MDTTVQNIDWIERVGRFALGMAVIVGVMTAEGILGWGALLPIIAVYPCITAVLGWDPVYAAMSRPQAARRHVPPAPRRAGRPVCVRLSTNGVLTR